MTQTISTQGQHIAVAFDQAYLPWAATLIRSHIIHHPRGSACFHILHADDLTRAEKHQLSFMVEACGGTIVYYCIGKARLEALPPSAQTCAAAWMRVFLPELIPELGRILYLDADTFVTGCLDDLWKTPLGNAPLAAVPNVVEPTMRSHVANLGLDRRGTVFNSGVLLMNLDVMRAYQSSATVVKTARELEGRLLWADQDALNVAFAKRWRPLHPRWNAQNSYWTWPTWAAEVLGAAALQEATENPAIRHFEGPTVNKPWHYLCVHPWQAEYRRVLASTPWADTPLVDRTAATMLVRQLPRSAQVTAYLRLERWRARSARRSVRPGGFDTSRRWRPGRRPG